MHDVSLQPIRMLLNYLRRQGADLRPFYEKIARVGAGNPRLRPEFFENPRNTVPWDTFVILQDAFEEYLSGPEEIAAFFESASTGESTSLAPLKMIGRLVSSPRMLYRLYLNVIGPSTYGRALQSTMEDLPDGRLRIRLFLPDDCASSPFFFRMCEMGLTTMPRMLGLPASRVTATLTDRDGEYLILPPKSATAWSRLRRACGRVLSPEAAFQELSEREQELREEYGKLLASETALLSTRAELESRVRALNTLAGGISHEINNVLQGVVLSLEGAEAEIGAGRSGDEKIRAAKKFAQRGMGVMEQVLTFSREALHPMSPVSPIPVVREAVELMRSTLSAQLSIRHEDSTGDAAFTVLGDETRLQQIIINLCANASYAMRAQGGTVIVRTRRAPDGFLEIEVADSGEGIPLEVRDRLFEPFFTTKPVGQGSGMGLSVVSGIVRAFGGRIAIESELGRGTTVLVRLPVMAVVAEPSRTNPAVRRLLVVDDEADLLEVLRETLEEAGYAITAVERAEEAMAILRGGGVDLVLADYRMPGLTGAGIARELKSVRPDVPVLLFTGVAGFSIPQHDRDLVRGVLHKPLDRAELVRAIRGVLDPAI